MRVARITREWSDNDVLRIQARKAEGRTWQQIADEEGATWEAVRCAARRRVRGEIDIADSSATDGLLVERPPHRICPSKICSGTASCASTASASTRPAVS